jgi:hypothetical protein
MEGKREFVVIIAISCTTQLRQAGVHCAHHYHSKRTRMKSRAYSKEAQGGKEICVKYFDTVLFILTLAQLSPIFKPSY